MSVPGEYERFSFKNFSPSQGPPAQNMIFSKMAAIFMIKFHYFAETVSLCMYV
jgi:hypothetical protein